MRRRRLFGGEGRCSQKGSSRCERRRFNRRGERRKVKDGEYRTMTVLGGQTGRELNSIVV